MLVMVVFFLAFRWIHLSTPLIRLFLLVLILLLMPTLNFFPVWFALSLLRFRLLSLFFFKQKTAYEVRLYLNDPFDVLPDSWAITTTVKPDGTTRTVDAMIIDGAASGDSL